MNVKKIIMAAIFIVVCFIIQIALPQLFPSLSVVPNLFLIITISFGFIWGKQAGVLVGFLCGVLLDCYTGTNIGYNALIYMYIGFFNGFLSHWFYIDTVLLPIILCVISEIIYRGYCYIFEFAVHGRNILHFYVVNRIAPELVFTTIITIFLYGIILNVNDRI